MYREEISTQLQPSISHASPQSSQGWVVVIEHTSSSTPLVTELIPLTLAKPQPKPLHFPVPLAAGYGHVTTSWSVR